MRDAPAPQEQHWGPSLWGEPLRDPAPAPRPPPSNLPPQANPSALHLPPPSSLPQPLRCLQEGGTHGRWGHGCAMGTGSPGGRSPVHCPQHRRGDPGRGFTQTPRGGRGVTVPGDGSVAGASGRLYREHRCGPLCPRPLPEQPPPGGSQRGDGSAPSHRAMRVGSSGSAARLVPWVSPRAHSDRRPRGFCQTQNFG